MKRIYIVSEADTPLSSDEQYLRQELMEAVGENVEFALTGDASQADIVVMFERTCFKTVDHADAIENCPFIQQHLGRLFVINKDDLAHRILPGLYTSLRRGCFDPLLYRPVNYYVSQNPRVLERVGVQRRPKGIASFRGNLRSHPLRRYLFDQLQGEAGFRLIASDSWLRHSPTAIEDYVEDILDHRFVLCPRGISPNTHRIYEAMALARCPVIISDEWVPPFCVDLKSCSIRVAEADVAMLPVVLQSRLDDAEVLGLKAFESWQRYLAPSCRMRYYLSQICDLARGQRDHAVSVEHIRSLGRDRTLRKQNGWTLRQRVVRRLRSSLMNEGPL